MTTEKPRVRRIRTRPAASRAIVTRDPALVEKRREELLLRQLEILAMGEVEEKKGRWSYTSPLRGGPKFVDKPFASEAEFLAYVEWAEERATAKSIPDGWGFRTAEWYRKA